MIKYMMYTNYLYAVREKLLAAKMSHTSSSEQYLHLYRQITVVYPLLHEHAVTCVILSVHFNWDGQTLSLMLIFTSCWLSNTCTTSVRPPPAAHIRGVSLSCKVHRGHTTEEKTLELTDHHPYYYWSLADNGSWTIQRDTHRENHSWIRTSTGSTESAFIPCGHCSHIAKVLLIPWKSL